MAPPFWKNIEESLYTEGGPPAAAGVGVGGTAAQAVAGVSKVRTVLVFGHSPYNATFAHLSPGPHHCPTYAAIVRPGAIVGRAGGMPARRRDTTERLAMDELRKTLHEPAPRNCFAINNLQPSCSAFASCSHRIAAYKHNMCHVAQMSQVVCFLLFAAKPPSWQAYCFVCCVRRTLGRLDN